MILGHDRRQCREHREGHQATPYVLVCHSQTSDASSPQLPEALQQKHATLVLRTTLAGNLQDFITEQPDGDPIPKQILARYTEEYRQSVDGDPSNADSHYLLSLLLVEL